MSIATLSSAPSSVKQAELLAMLERVSAGTLSVKAAVADAVVATAARPVKPSPVFVPPSERWHTPQKRAKPADRRGGRRFGAGGKLPLPLTLFREWELLCNTDPLTPAQSARLRVLTAVLTRSGRIVGDPDECEVRMSDGRVGVRVRPERFPKGVLESYAARRRS